MSKNQFNKKFKLMVKTPRYVIYSNTPPHMGALWARSVDATQASIYLMVEASENIIYSNR